MAAFRSVATVCASVKACTVSEGVLGTCSAISDETVCNNEAPQCTWDAAACTTTTSASTCAAAEDEAACTAAGDCTYADLETKCNAEADCEYDDSTGDDVCEAIDVDVIPRCTLTPAVDESNSAISAAREACLGGLTVESSECSYVPEVEFVPQPDCSAVFDAAVAPTEDYCPAGCTFEYDTRDDKIAAGCSYSTAPTKPPDNFIPPGCIKQGISGGACNSGAPYLTKLESNKWSIAVTMVVVPASLDLALTHVEVLAGAHNQSHRITAYTVYTRCIFLDSLLVAQRYVTTDMLHLIAPSADC